MGYLWLLTFKVIFGKFGLMPTCAKIGFSNCKFCFTAKLFILVTVQFSLIFLEIKKNTIFNIVTNGHMKEHGKCLGRKL